MFGGMHSWISRILYAIVGIAGIYALGLFNKVEIDDEFRDANTVKS